MTENEMRDFEMSKSTEVTNPCVCIWLNVDALHVIIVLL